MVRLLRFLLEYKVAILSLSLVALGACTDDLRESNTQKPTEDHSVSPLADELGKGNMVLDMDIEPLQGQNEARTDFYLEYRKARRGSTPTSTTGYNYDDEYTSTLTMKRGEKIRGVLVFIRQKNNETDKPLIVRKNVIFTVIDAPDHTDQYDTSKKPRVRWVGNVDFPSDYTLTKEYALPTSSSLTGADQVNGHPTKYGQWYVMAILDYTAGYFLYSKEIDPTKEDEKGYNKVYYNRNMLGKINQPVFVTEQFNTDIPTKRDPSTTRSLTIPYISQWRQVKIVQTPAKDRPTNYNYTGFINDLHFQPQGVLLQFDLSVATLDTQEIRRYGLISNQLDFKGYYDLEATGLYERFKNRNPSTGVGIPTWVPDPPTPSDFKLYYNLNAETNLFKGAQRISPWDMPTLSDNKTPTWGGDESRQVNTDDASLNARDVPAKLRKDFNTTNGGIATPEDLTNAWRFRLVGGNFPKENPSAGYVTLQTRLHFIFWGMPRSGASTNYRYTYFFASAYQSNYKEDIYNAQSSVNPKEGVEAKHDEVIKARIDFFNNEELIKKYEELVQQYPDANEEPGKTYKQLLNSAKDETTKLHAKYPESWFTKFTADSIHFYSVERPSIIKQLTPRTQPLIVLYQSNKTFEEHKVYHAQATLAPDLILTDVIYQTHKGENYSALEIYNPSCIWADLSQYAIARLIDNGTHMSFRKADGKPTDDITKAEILPLSLVAPNDQSPYNVNVQTLKSAFRNPHPYSYWGKNNLRRRVLMGDIGVRRNSAGQIEDFNYQTPYLRAPYPINGASTRWPPLGTKISNHYPIPSPDESKAGALNKAFLMHGQSMLLGASGYIHNPPVDDNSNIRPGGEWFRTVWYPAIYGSHTQKGFIRHFIAYADGVKISEGELENHAQVTAFIGYNIPGLKKFSKYKEGTLDMGIGDGFVLLKMTPLGDWQIIDATAPVGPHHEAFPGTYAAYKAHYAPLKTSKPESYSQQRMEGINYPFIPPFRTKQVTEHKYSDWSDSWRTTTTTSEYTIGYYIKEPQKITGRRFFNHGGWDLDPFNPVRTIFDKDFKPKWWPSYKKLRPKRR